MSRLTRNIVTVIIGIVSFSVARVDGLVKVLGYLSLGDDWQEYVLPHLKPIANMPAFEVAAWVVVGVCVVFLIWINLGETLWKKWKKNGDNTSPMEIRHNRFYENIVILYQAPVGRRTRKRCFVGVKNITENKILKNVRLRVTDISGFDDFRGIDLKVKGCDSIQVELAPGQEEKFQVIDQIIINNIGAAVTIGDDEKFACYWFPDEIQITLVALSDNGVCTERFWVEPNDRNEARLARRRRRTSLAQRVWPRWPLSTARKTQP